MSRWMPHRMHRGKRRGGRRLLRLHRAHRQIARSWSEQIGGGDMGSRWGREHGGGIQHFCHGCESKSGDRDLTMGAKSDLACLG